MRSFVDKGRVLCHHGVQTNNGARLASPVFCSTDYLFGDKVGGA